MSVRMPTMDEYFERSAATVAERGLAARLATQQRCDSCDVAIDPPSSFGRCSKCVCVPAMFQPKPVSAATAKACAERKSA